MRKGTLVILVLTLLAIVFALVLSTSNERKQRTLSEDEDPTKRSSATLLDGNSTAAVTPDAIERTAERSNAVSSVESEPNSAPSAPTQYRDLRIRVIAGADFELDHSSRIEVRAANFTGALYDAVPDGPATFLFKELKPGPFIVHAKSPRSRAGTTRVVVAADRAESEATVNLEPSRFVHIRWKSDDGRLITRCVTDATLSSGAANFEVRASWSSPKLEPGHHYSFATLRKSITSRADGPPREVTQLARGADLQSEALPATKADEFGVLEIEPGQSAWLSAWFDDRCLASKLVSADGEEVEFVTPCDALTPSEDPPARGFEPLVFDDVDALRRQNVDLLEFSVIDETGMPVHGVEFILVALGEAASSSGVEWGNGRRSFTSSSSVNLSFNRVRPGRYTLRCVSSYYSCESRVVEQQALTKSPSSNPIVISHAVLVGLGVDPVPPPRSSARWLTPNGTLVREADINEFGVATTYLAFGDYVLEIVERERVSRTSSIVVNRDPTVIDLHR